jgi:hypothetical protein
MYLDVLHSRNWDACLINVTVKPRYLLAGFCYFQAGVSSPIALFKEGSDQPFCRIAVPDEAIETPTFITITAPDDAIELEVLF